MTGSLTDALCTRCGLCCDGSLFADVELASRTEEARMALLGLPIDDVDDDADGHLMAQPCAALRGTRCRIYAHRPRCCRTFECGLLQGVRRGATTLERARAHVAEALGRIRRVQELLAKLGGGDANLPLRERCAEALATDTARDPRFHTLRASLANEMAALDRSLVKTFLPPARRNRRG